MAKSSAQPNRKPTAADIYRGEVVHWNDKKGYGFIHTSADKPNTFFHISSFAYHHRRPEKGQQISFLLPDGASAASRVVLLGHESALFTAEAYDQHTNKPYLAEAGVYAMLDILFFTVLATISTPICLASIIISILTFMLYSLDKHASIKRLQRVPEGSLHIAALLGGWPGALLARPLLRHKTSKKRFIVFFWMSIFVNFFCLYGITWYFSPLYY